MYPPNGGGSGGGGGGSGGSGGEGMNSTPTVPGNTATACPSPAITQHLSDPPYDDYFYSDCQVAAQVVVTTPRSNSNLSIIGPRLIVAWPAGNSGVAAFFAPQNGVNGSLAIHLMNSSSGATLSPVSRNVGGKYPSVGVSGIINFNSSAKLTVALLGSVRTLRDFTEGPSLLQPKIQQAIKATPAGKRGAVLTRLWLDNVTTTEFGFIPMDSSKKISIDNQTLMMDEGNYLFYADFNYPQLTQLPANKVLNAQSQGLISQNPDQTTSLSFLSYSQKLLAGAWRFLTYFGRDSMIASLLLSPVLSEGEGGAFEAVIGAVLERLNSTDGSVAHEETIGDYATFLHAQENVTSTAPSYNYVMIDSDYYLPVLMDRYFLQTGTGMSRVQPFLSTPAGSINPANSGLSYSQIALINAKKIMGIAAQFAAPGNQTIQNLAHLKSGQIVGQWRDSTYGTSIPFSLLC